MKYPLFLGFTRLFPVVCGPAVAVSVLCWSGFVPSALAASKAPVAAKVPPAAKVDAATEPVIVAATPEQVKDFFTEQLNFDGLTVNVVAMPAKKFLVKISGTLETWAKANELQAQAKKLKKQLGDTIQPLLFDLKTAPAPVAEKPHSVSERWPLTFLSTSKDGSTSDSLDKEVAALNAHWGRDMDKPLVSHDKYNLYLTGTPQNVLGAKSQIALMDAPWPQVQLDVWAVQSSGKAANTSRDMAKLSARVRYAQSEMKASQLTLLNVLQTVDVPPLAIGALQYMKIGDFSAVEHSDIAQSIELSPFPQSYFDGSAHDLAEAIRDENNKNLSLEEIIKKRMKSNLSDGQKKEAIKKLNIKSVNIGAPTLIEMLVLLAYSQNREGVVSDFAEQVAHGWYDERTLLLEREVLVQGQLASAKRSSDTIAYRKPMQTELEGIRQRLLDLNLRLQRYHCLTPDGRFLSPSPLLFSRLRTLLPEITRASDTEAAIRLSIAIKRFGDLQNMLSNGTTIGYDKYEKYHVVPDQLARQASYIDGMFKAVIEALQGDLQDIYLIPLLANLQEGGNNNKTGISLIGKTHMVVTSGRPVTLKPAMHFAVEASQPKPFGKGLFDDAFPGTSTNTSSTKTTTEPKKDADGKVVKDSEGNPIMVTTTSTETAKGSGFTDAVGYAGTVAKMSNLGALGLSALFLSDPEPVYTMVAPGISIEVTPSVLPDGGSARLEMTASFGVKSTLPSNASTVPGVRLNRDAATIEEHTVTTDATVNGFDLFEMSSFSFDTTVPGIRSVPLLSQIPTLGKLFQQPIRTHEHQESTLLVLATILPRTLGLVHFYSPYSDAEAEAEDVPQYLKTLRGTRR